MNPDWSILPCVTFVEGKGPLIATYRKHNSGCNKDYLHLPRQPHNIVASDNSDKLCHDVIETRAIKQIKTNKYRNAFQMYEQRG